MARLQHVFGNWKMNLSRAAARELADAVAQLGKIEGPRVGVFPSPVHLSEVAGILASSAVGVGAQDCAAEDPGAYTGATSAAQLAEVGAQWVLVGHSERRHHFGEDDRLVARKFAAVAAAGMQPVLCVGETLEERRRGETADRIRHQLDAVVEAGLPGSFIVAYEPVWAIGTGENAGLDDVVKVHALIRARLDEAGPGGRGQATPILYGGSVSEANAPGYLGHPEVDGALVGGASLDPARFASICGAGPFPAI